jgi:glycine/D-amino acid oxidase-like deaminating enzyme
MKDDSQASTSLWMATADMPSQSRLKESIRTDVCIIGAGIAGLTTAYLLGREGRSVVVLDGGLSGGGMTGRTTAHLTNAYDDRYVEIEKLHGEEGSRLTAESHTAAIEKIHQIDSFNTGPALRFPRQAQFHPLKYLDGLVKAIMRDDGRVFHQTHATKIEGGAQARIETSHGPVVTSEVVVQPCARISDVLSRGTRLSKRGIARVMARDSVPKGEFIRDQRIVIYHPCDPRLNNHG